MGCDGGSIPHRSEMVKEKQKVEQPDKEQTRQVKWTTCSLSKLPLVEPIYADALGNLYNYDSILEYLIDRNKFGITPSIRKLKDVVKLKVPRDETGFYCPITKKEMNGSFEFVYLGCGCCTSQSAITIIDTNYCPVCSKEFSKDQVVTINPTDSKLQEMIETQKRTKAAAALKRKGEKAVINNENGKSGLKRKQLDEGRDQSKKNINIIVPDISVALEAADKKIKSSSLKSLYEKSTKKQTFLTMGCFNRYATGS